MPPKGDPLTKEQIALLEKWIAEGAVVPGQMDAVVEGDVGSLVARSRWCVLKCHTRPDAKTAIDAFLLQRLTEKMLAYNGAADARSLDSSCVGRADGTGADAGAGGAVFDRIERPTQTPPTRNSWMSC